MTHKPSKVESLFFKKKVNNNHCFILAYIKTLNCSVGKVIAEKKKKKERKGVSNMLSCFTCAVFPLFERSINVLHLMHCL